MDSSNVSDALSLFVARTGLPDPRTIHEVRELIEIQTTRLAAQRATDERRGRILAALEQRDVEASVRAMEQHLRESLDTLMGAQVSSLCGSR